MSAPQAMRVYRSNRAERLVEALARVVEVPLLDPLAPEQVVVQSRGMERWLSMQLSQRLGIAANLRFPFPRHLIERAFDCVLGEEPERAAPFARDALAWSIADILRQRIDEPAFAVAKSYLRDDVGGVLCLQLSRRLGEALDDYAAYRPELLLEWEAGAEPVDLQAELLRALVARHGAFHQAARAQRLLQALAHPVKRIEDAFESGELPRRVCLFGIASLPPLYVSLLSALAKHIETHLFVVTPSSEYFADVRKKQRSSAGQVNAGSSLAGTNVEGHPLLASLGRLGRDFQAVLESHAVTVETEEELFEDPGTDNVLHTLQSDMLRLRNRGVDRDVPRLPLDPADSSLTIHACHSPMREIEVLHDQLAQLLEDESLQAHEIVVMAPDIETYAPVIEAVFGQTSGRPYIPFSVAHRGLKPESAVLDALQAALDLLGDRVTSGALLDLLARDPVREHESLSPDDIETLRAWVEHAGIRWGIDEGDRAALGQPPLVEGTFRFGLERMLLGYALEGRGQVLFGERLPFDAVQGRAAALAGSLAEFCERLFRHREVVRSERSVAQWAEAFESLLMDLVGEGVAEIALERVAIRQALNGVVEQAELAGFTAPIALRALWPAVEASIDSRAAARGFLSRGVTFCQLVPMRSVPFKVACLLGMGDERFPARRAVHGFDRLQQAPKVGDRVPRDDDRHVFLEALMCARERFLITYVGRSAHDDRELPPAVVVTDLLDAVARGFELPPVRDDQPALDPRAAIEQRLTVRHRLHAFSARYFMPEALGGDPRLFSYASSYCEGAQSLGRDEAEPRFIAKPLSLAPLTELSVDRLVGWVTQPIKTLVQHELRVYLGSDFEPIPDREPGKLDPLGEWILRTELSGLLLDGVPEAALLELARAGGGLPIGANGTVSLEDVLSGTQKLVHEARRFRSGDRLPPEPVDLIVGGVRITGVLRSLWPCAQLELSYSKQGKRFELAHFVRHVVLCALREQGRSHLPSASVVIGRTDGDEPYVVSFGPIERPIAVLSELLALVNEARAGRLPFEHNAAYEYAFTVDEKGDAAARSTAVATLKNSFDPKLFLDAYLNLLYPDAQTFFDAGFADAATRVFQRMIAARTQLEAS